MNCLHIAVCRHVEADGDVCTHAEVCRHRMEVPTNKVIPPEKPPKKERVPFARKSKKKAKPITVKPKKDKGSAMDEKKLFAKAKVFLSTHRAHLTENQSLAFATIQGKHYSGLNESQVHQIIEMAADVERSMKEGA